MREALRARRIFRRRRTDEETVALGIVLYHLGLSLRDASLVLRGFRPRSPEAIREWYHRSRDIFQVRRRPRRALAVDETRVKLQGKWIYVWAAVDVDTWEVLFAWATPERSGSEALAFLRKVPESCDGKPVVYVDGGPWYRWPLDRLGIPWEHRTFGPRNPIGGWFGILKQRIKRFYRRWPWNASLGGADGWVKAFVSCYNLGRSPS